MRPLRILPAVVVLLASASASGRQIETWSYERLFKEADLVVIAAATEVRPGDHAAPEGHYRTVLVPQVAVLEVRATLKGEARGGRVEVAHFKLADGALVQNGPLLVAFRTKEIRVESPTQKSVVPPPEYLLFLKADKDGRFSPVSGPIDSRLSVREVYPPLSPRVFGEEPTGPLRHE